MTLMLPPVNEARPSSNHTSDCSKLSLQGHPGLITSGGPGFLWGPRLCRACAMPSPLVDCGQQLAKASDWRTVLPWPRQGRAQLLLEIDSEPRAHTSPHTMTYKRLSFSSLSSHLTSSVPRTAVRSRAGCPQLSGRRPPAVAFLGLVAACQAWSGGQMAT